MTEDAPKWFVWIPLVALVFTALGFLINSRYDRLIWLWPPVWFRRKPDIVIGVVVRADEVLLVHRKPAKGSDLHWQFPSGQLGAERDLEQRMRREVLSETGVEVRAVKEIGRRRHPKTGRICVYFLSEYVAGEALNLQPHENIYVAWVSRSELEAYLGGSLFPKVKTELKLS